MAITQERFAEGLTYPAYKEQMTRNRDRLEKNEQTVELVADDVTFFAQLPQPLKVVAIAEDWCGDVVNNLPVLARLAEASGKLDVRIFLRDQNLDLIDQYLNQGQFRSIPVFAFFDPAFQEIGHWIERPALITELTGAFRQNLFATEPLLAGYAPTVSPSELPEAARDRYTQAFATFRAEQRQRSDREVVRELRALIEQA
ncbi:MAG: thioredoxin family protein [Caldilineaceae bacterium]|nr:thioredoxin family protein [Caldilineaceae bacterium]